HRTEAAVPKETRGAADPARATGLEDLPKVQDVVAVLRGRAVLPGVRWRRASGRIAGVVDVRHALPSVTFRFVVGNLADEPGGCLDLAFHVADQRSRVHADTAHGGIGHADVGQDVVAALGQIDVAVAVPLPVAGGLPRDNGSQQVGRDTVALRGGIDVGRGGSQRATSDGVDV